MFISLNEMLYQCISSYIRVCSYWMVIKIANGTEVQMHAAIITQQFIDNIQYITSCHISLFACYAQTPTNNFLCNTNASKTWTCIYWPSVVARNVSGILFLDVINITNITITYHINNHSFGTQSSILRDQKGNITWNQHTMYAIANRCSIHNERCSVKYQ